MTQVLLSPSFFLSQCMCMHDRYGTTYSSFAGISVLKLAGNSGHYLKGVELNSCSYVLIYRYAFIDSVYIIDLIRVFQNKTKLCF